MPADVIGYLYAATVAAGGIMGYVKAGMLKVNHTRNVLKDVHN